MSAQQGHSLLPWSQNQFGATGRVTEGDKLNDAFILRAVNSHASLVAALEELVAAEGASIDRFTAEEIDRIECAMANARSALAAAKSP